tara:strand:+ start:514 stop:741 length:228 start_codon:yes stop_codon:yes gene_type:complete
MRKIKLPQQAHLMGEPSLVPPDFFPPKKKYMTYEEAVHADDRFLVSHEDEPSEAMEEEELINQWMWYEYNNEENL